MSFVCKVPFPAGHSSGACRSSLSREPAQLLRKGAARTKWHQPLVRSQLSAFVLPHKRRRCLPVARSSVEKFDADDIAIERRIASVGVMTVTSVRPVDSSEGASATDFSSLQQLQGAVDAKKEAFEIQIYSGRVARGRLMGARLILKAYPPPLLARSDPVAAELDLEGVADNEIRTHTRLQEPAVPEESPYLVKLLGHFEVSSGAAQGQRWLAFHSVGGVSMAGAGTAGQYALTAAKATAEGTAVGEGEFTDFIDKDGPLRRRKVFILKILRDALRGLAFMHANDRVHQSLFPESLLLSSTEEREASFLRVRLYDFGFALDVSDAALMGGATLGDLWDSGGRSSGTTSGFRSELVRRAQKQGATDAEAQRAFGKADDMCAPTIGSIAVHHTLYLFGLMCAYMVFVPLSEPDSVDLLTLQRLVEVTFRNDFSGLRSYVAEEPRWAAAAEFLEAGDAAGWKLLEGCLSQTWRTRPTAAQAIVSPFLEGAGMR